MSSAGDLNGVVRSMKALAAASIGQYESASDSLNHYYRTIELGLAACLRQASLPAQVPERKGKNPGPVGVVIIGSDQGLVGQFNDLLTDYALGELKKIAGKPERVWAIGERVHTILLDSGLAQATLMPVPISVYAITDLVDRLLIDIDAALEKGEIEGVYLFHNRPKKGAILESVMRQLLPLDRAWQRSLATLPWPTKCLPEVIEGPKPTLSAFVRGYLFVLLFQACAESLASENASRLAAMQRAEKNIKEVLAGLKRTFHRIRQEGIDEELFDVISGFEAQSKRK
jgi:F-type H+-transporting ATPase subunit gamma